MTGLLIGLLVAQGLFAKAYGVNTPSGFRETIYSVIQTPDGGFLIGAENGNDSGGVMTKINPNGSVLWANLLWGGWESFTKVIRTTDGGYAGVISSIGGAFSHVMKVNSAGTFQWSYGYEWWSNIELWSLVQTTDGGYAVGGWGWASGGNTDPIIVKLSSTGAVQWARSIGGADLPELDYAYSMVLTSDLGYAILGERSNGDLILVKLSSAPAVQWAVSFGGPYYEDCHSPNALIQTTDGGYAIAASTQSYGAGDYDWLIVKLDGSGSLVWAKTLGGTGDDQAAGITQTADGGYVVCGSTGSYGAGSWDLMVVRLDGSGNLLWSRTFGGTDSDGAYSVIQTSDGGFALGGYTYSFGAGGQDWLLMRLDANGNYPDCVLDCVPTANNVSPSVLSISVSLTPQTVTRFSDDAPVSHTPAVADVCTPLYAEEEEHGPGSRVVCSPLSGAALFLSHEEISLNIYASDGRLIYSGQLQKGENRIGLETGVYFWKAGAYKGKAVVR